MMLVFPQLNSGAGGQYPLIRRRKYSPVTNLLSDGSMVSYRDSSPAANAWQLNFRDLTDAEAGSIQTLFQTVEGRRGAFTFIDPTANLLAYSEALDRPCWTKSPMIQIDAGIADPLGGMQAIRLINAGQGAQTISQSLPAPAWFSYCFSVYARSLGGPALSLTRSSSSASYTRQFPLGSDWSRCILPGALNTTAQAVEFLLEVPAGGSVDVFGLQVEAQPAPSAYKRTAGRNGIYSKARFDMDALAESAAGPDQHSINLKIVAKD